MVVKLSDGILGLTLLAWGNSIGGIIILFLDFDHMHDCTLHCSKLAILMRKI